MSTLEVNSLQHLDATVNNLDLDSSGNATVNGNMTATEFYGGGGNLTGVGVDGIVSTANATAIKINSSEFVGIGGSFDAKKQLHIQNNTSDCMIILDTAGAAVDKIIEFCKEYGDGGSGSNYWSIGVDASDELFTIAYDASSQASVGADRQFTVFDNGKCQSKNGILFGTDTAAANTLDDYEEGTWTPVFAGASSAGTYTYLTRAGHYTKVGDLVTVTGYFCNLAASSAGSGNAMITGLPYSPRGMSNSYGPVGAVVATYCTISGTLVVWPTSSGVLYLIDVRSGQDRTHFSPGSISSGSTDIGWTAQYHTDS